jgi:hypothetical protein
MKLKARNHLKFIWDLGFLHIWIQYKNSKTVTI